jgi:hypothetical protein
MAGPPVNTENIPRSLQRGSQSKIRTPARPALRQWGWESRAQNPLGLPRGGVPAERRRAIFLVSLCWETIRLGVSWVTNLLLSSLMNHRLLRRLHLLRLRRPRLDRPLNSNFARILLRLPRQRQHPRRWRHLRVRLRHHRLRKGRPPSLKLRRTSRPCLLHRFRTRLNQPIN